MSAQPTGTSSAVTTMSPLRGSRHVLAVVAQKGGVGKTATAVNLATSLAARGVRVCLVDLDPQHNATTYMGLEPDHDLLSVALMEGLPIRPRVCAFGVDVLVGGGGTDGITNPTQSKLDGRLASLLNASAAAGTMTHEVIIIDTPPTAGALTTIALTAATQVLVPVQAETAALDGLAQTFSRIDYLKERGQPVEVLGSVLTLEDRRVSLSAEVAEELEAYPPAKAFAARIPRNIRVAESYRNQVPVVLDAPGAAGAVAYEELADEVLRRLIDG